MAFPVAVVQAFMHIAIINPPFRNPSNVNEWITLPPQGYGGIQWFVTNLIDGLAGLRCTVSVLGAPGSRSNHENVRFYNVVDREGVQEFLAGGVWDIVHDHTNGAYFDATWTEGKKFVGTHHLTGPPVLRNCVFSSHAQARAAFQSDAPVVRIPVNLERYPLQCQKADYLLFLGRVSPWKGTREAAAFAKAAGRRLVVAGPTWETEYASAIKRDFGGTVDFVGTAGGEWRRRLIREATAILVLSQPVHGPWGHVWCEPGATVVSEAAACGTPVISSKNGCLPEIVPGVGVCLDDDFDISGASTVLNYLPAPRTVRSLAYERWNHGLIAKLYLDLYQMVEAGHGW